MLILVVSDTSDRTHLGQKPGLARGFVGVSDSTITSFSWLLIEIDTPVLTNLERLQRQRRGETVPPPLNINLGRSSLGRRGIYPRICGPMSSSFITAAGAAGKRNKLSGHRSIWTDA
jgi:hypothetical protein